MSLFIDCFEESAKRFPDRVAFYNTAGESITYFELDVQSDALAQFFRVSENSNRPVLLYGNKEPLMLVGIIACLKAGCPYSVIDGDFPKSYLEYIFDTLGRPMVVCACNVDLDFLEPNRIVNLEKLQSIVSSRVEKLPKELHVKGDDAAYLLFTSGSTGRPKCVEQKAETLDCIMEYMRDITPDNECDEGMVIFDRSLFSCDTSIKGIVMSLSGGNALFSLAREAEKSISLAFKGLSESNFSVWISLTTYLELCLSDPTFDKRLLRNAKSFLVIGEVLHNSTAREFLKRFPNAKLFNAYGVLEANTVSITPVTHEMVSGDKPLPVGYASPYNSFAIHDRQTQRCLPTGEAGEIIIFGDTLANGYVGMPELTAQKFKMLKNATGKTARGYVTGDKGYLDADGMLHFVERYDLMTKVRGIRVEVSAIEDVLNEQNEVAMSCVIPVCHDGKARSLRAFVKLKSGVSANRDTTRALKGACRENLFAYMIPRSFRYVDEFPMTRTGKIDRRTLEKM